jgi:pimeloyl-ACP methyl ester carboxylesterase
MKNKTLSFNLSQILIVMILILAAILLAACGGSKETPITVPTGAEAGDLTMEPCTYEAGDVEYAADCGTLVVRENRNDPNSRLIALPILRIRATGENPGEPIFDLGGGPGDSNMGFSRVSWFIENYDIVTLGFRGVDGSVVLDCPEVSEHFRNLPGDFLGHAALKNMAASYSQCAQRLENEGVDTDGYTVIEVIDDLEAARSALGYDQINLLSGSYGTRLAMLYAWKYPDNIHRSAMIAVNPPGHFVYEPEFVDEQINYYAALCAQDLECSARTDDLAQTIREVSHNMPDRWLLFPLNAGMIKAATFESLANTTDAAMVFDVWLAAAKGDYSGMALLTLAGPMMFAEATVWGDNAAKAVSVGDYDFSHDYATEMNPPDSIIGSPRSIMADAWTGWPANRIPEEYRQVQPSDVETLLVSGSIDFFTPAEFATDELLPALSNGQQVILAEFGHTSDVYRLQPEATRHLLSRFFATGEADDSLYTYHAVNFKAGLGFPAIAKIIVAVILLVIAILVAVVWFIARRVRRS